MAFSSADMDQPQINHDTPDGVSDTVHSAALAALVGSRLCHDLISPVGAIQNGLELATLTPTFDAGGEEMQLMMDSVHNAASKLKFFRMAFGTSGDDAPVNRRMAQTLFDDATRGTRMRADVTGSEMTPRSGIQMAMLGFLCLETVLPMGGRIGIDIALEKTTLKVVEGQPTPNHPLWAFLNNFSDISDLTPAHVQFALLPTLAQMQNRLVQKTEQDGALVLTF